MQQHEFKKYSEFTVKKKPDKMKNEPTGKFFFAFCYY